MGSNERIALIDDSVAVVVDGITQLGSAGLNGRVFVVAVVWRYVQVSVTIIGAINVSTITILVDRIAANLRRAQVNMGVRVVAVGASQGSGCLAVVVFVAVGASQV